MRLSILMVLLPVLVACPESNHMNAYDPTTVHSGYRAGIKDWRAFLDCWEQELMQRLNMQVELHTRWEQTARERGSLSYPGADEGRIRALERRLEHSLPPSYRQFLSVTNGWIQIGFDADDALVLPSEEVNWLRSKAPEVIADWSAGSGGIMANDEEYFVYGPQQDPVQMRDDYLQTALMISEVADAGVYLLNPKVQSQDGEWEAWFFGWEVPGAIRFRSFAELMRNAYFLAVHQPDVMYPYREDQMSETCVDLLPVHD